MSDPIELQENIANSTETSGGASRIVISGDVPLALFQLPANQAKIEVKDGDGNIAPFEKTALFPIRVGAAHAHATVRAILEKYKKNHTLVWHKETKKAWEDETDPERLFALKAQKPLDDKSPCFRIDEDFQPIAAYGNWKTLSVAHCDYKADGKPSRLPTTKNVKSDDILVSWFRYPESQKSTAHFQSGSCKFHIQIGGLHNIPPENVAAPEQARIIVTSLFEASKEHRIRKGLSYETMAIDFLRSFRGAKQFPEWQRNGMFPLLHRGDQSCFSSELSPFRIPPHLRNAPGAPCFLVVRFSSSAVMVYSLSIDRQLDGSYQQKDKAWFFFHKDRPAPIDTPTLGRVQGYTGFLGAHLAVAAAGAKTAPDLDLTKNWFGTAIKDSLLWQAKLFEQGFFRMFFTKLDKKVSGKWVFSPIKTEIWNTERLEFFRCFSVPTEETREDIHTLEIDIPEAVSYRKHWFMAKDILRDKEGTAAQISLKASEETWRKDTSNKGKYRPDEKALTKAFRAQGIAWLSSNARDPKDDVPIAKIGKLELVDRAEIEDYLAIQAALHHYCDSENSKPLNIGVFGSPGSGKSFGVKEVASHIRKTTKKLAEHPVTFNLSQFTSLNHLMTAFHEVRNKCLSGTIPLVFFDEFDSAFENRPFGWLKYFLAPMQDGEFVQEGITHRLGRAIFVFAGGINRTFDELDSRSRNISFVEAKGPDFISRLRGHLNIRGINEPDDEHDQGRYLLRRAVKLHGIAVRELEHKGNELRPKDGLMAKGVARAFLSVKRFKHGVRSMESIIGMCDTARGRRIEASDLPTKKQLEMHVDAGEFLAELKDE